MGRQVEHGKALLPSDARAGGPTLESSHFLIYVNSIATVHADNCYLREEILSILYIHVMRNRFLSYFAVHDSIGAWIPVRYLAGHLVNGR